MAIIAVLLGTIGKWPFAGAWWIAYATIQLAISQIERRTERLGDGPLHVASFVSFAVAGFPTWHMWTECGLLGAVCATMFLCGMLAQLVASSLAAHRLFLASALPLVAYLLVVPPLTFGPSQPKEAFAVCASAIVLLIYLAVLWRGQQEVLQSVLRSRTQAEAANRAKTEFLATMSHEIRTPMNAVLGAADLLGRTELTAEQRDHVTMLQDAGGVLMQVLNDVLDLSKIEAGKLSIERTVVDLRDLMHRSANFWRPRALDAGLELRVEMAPDTARFVVIDPTRTGQILFNLISNALKFTARGAITLRAEIRPANGGDVELRLSVCDTGIGIAPDALQRLFTAFEQADSSITRRFGGTGLGLAISQRLAAMMGGKLDASSTEGQGSTFVVTLPATLADAFEAPAQEPDVPSLEGAGGGLRILVAEDNPANQRIIEHFLRPIGAEVTLVGDGRQAVEILQVQAFHVVLMDMQMPVMDGLEATRQIRALAGPNRDTPILALTANAMEEQREACFAAGMTDHIAKPIDARLLLSAVLKAGMASQAKRAAKSCESLSAVA